MPSDHKPQPPGKGVAETPHPYQHSRTLAGRTRPATVSA